MLVEGITDPLPTHGASLRFWHAESPIPIHMSFLNESLSVSFKKAQAQSIHLVMQLNKLNENKEENLKPDESSCSLGRGKKRKKRERKRKAAWGRSKSRARRTWRGSSRN